MDLRYSNNDYRNRNRSNKESIKKRCNKSMNQFSMVEMDKNQKMIGIPYLPISLYEFNANNDYPVNSCHH